MMQRLLLMAPMVAAHMDMGNDTGMGMEMYFHFRLDEQVLFKGWKISTVGGMVGSVLGIFLMALLYEAFKFYREHLFRRQTESVAATTPILQHKEQKEDTQAGFRPMLNSAHALQTFLHVAQVFFSYCLMLIFMTYNGWLCIALLLGSGCGYFLFGWKRPRLVDISEHCH